MPAGEGIRACTITDRETGPSCLEEEIPMKRALVTMLFIVCSLSARADDPAARRAITEQYARYDKACLKGMAGLATWCEKTLTPDFTVTAGGKTMSRHDF